MQQITSALWPEDIIPSSVKGCSKCELCKQRSRIIWGEGNPKADIIIILDNPGCREDKYGELYVCGTRQTIQLAAGSVGFSKEDLYITYVLKCKPMRKYNKEASRLICLGYLEQQLRDNNFKVAFCLGDTAVKAFFSDSLKNVKDMRGRWHITRNIPTYVSYHPLAVRRRPNLFNNFIKDWEQVAQINK